MVSLEITLCASSCIDEVDAHIAPYWIVRLVNSANHESSKNKIKDSPRVAIYTGYTEKYDFVNYRKLSLVRPEHVIRGREWVAKSQWKGERQKMGGVLHWPSLWAYRILERKLWEVEEFPICKFACLSLTFSVSSVCLLHFFPTISRQFFPDSPW